MPLESVVRTKGIVAPRYRYTLHDLLTDQLLADLPLTGVSYGRRINRPDGLSGTLNVPNANAVRLAKMTQRRAGRAALYVYRNGVLWWGGILWSATPQQDRKGNISLAVDAATFESYPFHRIIRDDLEFGHAATTPLESDVLVEQSAIIQGLWDHMQSDPRGDIGVETVSAVQDTGVDRTRKYLASETESYGDQMQELCDVLNGPEYTIDVYADPDGTRHKRLRVASQLGGDTPVATFGRAELGSGGRVLTWGEPTDATASGTAFQARGATRDGNVGQDKQPLMSDVYESDDLLSAGWPLLDVTEDHTTVKNLDRLNEHAQAARDRYSGAVKTNTYTVSVDGTGWSPNRIGEPVRLMLSDLWHTPPQTVTVRPVAFKVTAGDRSTPESVDLIFGDDAATGGGT